MTRSIYRVFFVFSILGAFHSSIYCQVEVESRSIDVECIEDSENQFLIDGELYKSSKKKDVYVCPLKFPLEISLVDTESNIAIGNANIVWEANGDLLLPDSNGYIYLDINNHFTYNKCELIAEYNGVNYTINVFNNLFIDFIEKDYDFAFDQNSHQEYIEYYGGTEMIGTPWSVIIKDQQLEVGATVRESKKNKKKTQYSNSTNLTATNPSVSFSPSILTNKSEQTIAIDYPDPFLDQIDVKGCDTQPELLLYPMASQVYTARFYRVCESDDDTRKFCENNIGFDFTCQTKITDPNFICIDGGADRLLDEHFKPGRISNHDLKDIGPDGRILIRAGEDLECNTKVEHNPIAKIECPDISNYNVSVELNNATELFKSIGASYVPDDIVPIDLHHNYDLYVDDETLSEEEQKWWGGIDLEHILPPEGSNSGPDLVVIFTAVQNK